MEAEIKKVRAFNYPLDILVDADKYDKISKYNWTIKFRGLTPITIQRFSTKQKHVILSRWLLNVTDPNLEVDHKDRNVLNNCISNLRIADSIQNMANRGPITGEYKGVFWRKDRNKWHARFKYLNIIKQKYFIDPIEAAKWYDIQAYSRHGEFAYLNFPEELPNGLRKT